MPQPRPPQDHDQAAHATAVRVVTDGRRDGDDLSALGRSAGQRWALLRGRRPAWEPGMVAAGRSDSAPVALSRPNRRPGPVGPADVADSSLRGRLGERRRPGGVPNPDVAVTRYR